MNHSKRTETNKLSLAGQVSKESWGLLVGSTRETTRPRREQTGTLLCSPTHTAEKKGDTTPQCTTHSTFRETSAEEIKPTLCLLTVHPQESNSLRKSYRQGYSDRHSSQEMLSLHPGTKQPGFACWNDHTRGMWLLAASTEGGGGNMGNNKREATHRTPSMLEQ